MADTPRGSGSPAQDLAIGLRIRDRRRRVGLSQQALASTLGISFQQVQRYERGASSIAVSRLAKVAQALGCRPDELASELGPDRER